MSKLFNIELTDGVTNYKCESDDTLLSAGLRAELGLAYECSAGACGSCKFDLIEGEVKDLFPEAKGIRPKERDRGKRLACQCQPLTDCLIKIRTDDEYISEFLPRRFTAKLIDCEEVTHDITKFTFISDSPAGFLPGQYLLMSLPFLSETRAYSISNIANDDGTWQFMIRRVIDGKFSKFLFDKLEIGDVVNMDGPYGLAYLRKDSKRPIVGIAGGSGLAPVLSILRGAAKHGNLVAGSVLLYGGRGPSDIPKVSEALAREGISVPFYPVVSDQSQASEAEWKGDIGFIHDYIEKKVENSLDSCEYYMAGPPIMIESVMRLLVRDHKVPVSQIHFDRFF